MHLGASVFLESGSNGSDFKGLCVVSARLGFLWATYIQRVHIAWLLMSSFPGTSAACLMAAQIMLYRFQKHPEIVENLVDVVDYEIIELDIWN